MIDEEKKHDSVYLQNTDLTTDKHINPKDPSSDTRVFNFEGGMKDELKSRWTSIQAQFVDQPCTSIEQADALVTDALERMHQMYVQQQGALRERWYDHEDISTEDLRVMLQDYRSFLNRLLSQ